MIKQKHSFSIENKVNPNTGKAFGAVYAGTFPIQFPLSIGDKLAIACKNSAYLNTYGQINPDLISPTLKLMAYCVAFVSTIATAKLPEWFNLDALSDDNDEAAVFAVWQEVGGNIGSFRPGNDPTTGGDGGKES